MITVVVIRTVSITLVIVLNRFIFFANLSRTSISSSKNASILISFLKRYDCGSCSAIGFRSE